MKKKKKDQTLYKLSSKNLLSIRLEYDSVFPVTTTYMGMNYFLSSYANAMKRIYAVLFCLPFEFYRNIYLVFSFVIIFTILCFLPLQQSLISIVVEQATKLLSLGTYISITPLWYRVYKSFF